VTMRSEEGSTTKPSDFSRILAPFHGRRGDEEAARARGDEEAARAMQSNAATLGSSLLIRRRLLGSDIVVISPKPATERTDKRSKTRASTC